MGEELTATSSAACTAACTGEDESANANAPKASQFPPEHVGAADPNLTEVMTAWPTLPAAIRAGILAMVRASASDR